MNFKNNLQKKLRLAKQLLAIVIVVVLLVMQTVQAQAIEAPVAPTAPDAPSAPTAPSSDQTAPQAPVAPTAPVAPSAPTAPSAPSFEQIAEPTAPSETQDTSDSQNTDTSNSPSEAQTTSNPETSSPQANQTIGDATVQTGDATNTGVLSTLGNDNLQAIGGSGNGSSPGVSVVNDGNGASSTNNGSVSLTDNTNTFQNNSAGVDNILTKTSVTGQNSASQNVGDSTITTGNANTSGTVITGVNTNVDGVAVSQFTVADDHTGDIILDFASSCVSGCANGSLLAKNTDNGISSQNTSDIQSAVNNNTFQTNDASVENNLTLVSDSGNNTASQNTGGASTITTGDSNVAANVLTFVNNNLSGNVVFGVIDIFGNLVGDIILSEDAIAQAGCATCNASIAAANNGNGTNSTNNASVNATTSDTTFQTNDATIENNLTFSATSGNNDVSKNTGGDSYVNTGSAAVDSKTVNIANSNVDGGNWWLVIVNKAGQWIGQILGAPEGATFAGSSGTEFSVDADGNITAVNSGNGQSSQNNSSVAQTTNNTTVQNNTAHVVNNLDLSANTGGNQASQNTGNDSTIKTGDAKVLANLINFVNNNIAGSGKLIVTFVNVFGSWAGDFVTPGTQKKDASQPSIASNTQSLEDNASSDDANAESAEVARGGMGPDSSDFGSDPEKTNSEDITGNDSGHTFQGAIGFSSASTFSTNGKQGSVFGSDSNSGANTLAVAGISTGGDLPSDSVTLAKNMSINLAWLVILLPLFALAVLAGKKTYVLKKLLTKHTKK